MPGEKLQPKILFIQKTRFYLFRMKDYKSGIIDDIIPPFAIQTYVW